MMRNFTLVLVVLSALLLGGCRERYVSALTRSWYHNLDRDERRELAQKIVIVEGNPKLPRAIGLFCLVADRDCKEEVTSQLFYGCFLVDQSPFPRALLKEREPSENQLAYAEVLARYQKDPSRYLAGPYPAEVSFDLVRGIEHKLWYTGTPDYLTVQDMAKAYRSGELSGGDDYVPKPFYLASGIGRLDWKHRELYRMTTEKVWLTITTLARECDSLPERTFRIDSLSRCSSYPLKQGAKDTSHCFGGAFDIDLDNPSAVELTVLHEALYKLALEGRLAYYVEANTASRNNKISVGHVVPYDFANWGQVHVIVNPNFKERWSQ